MMKEQMTVEMLRYQIAKYRAMGNGAMCQELTALLQQKLATAVA
ncbi:MULTISPECIES: hypothetical protein [Barnesiella]|nr:MULTISPECIES: hypothetical protein [Barnesiella]MCR8910536.1 hypothetical protein [Barnesiella sp. ET7]MDM8267901.1 hypothetical protein [Barnesiella viscericola]